MVLFCFIIGWGGWFFLLVNNTSQGLPTGFHRVWLRVAERRMGRAIPVWDHVILFINPQQNSCKRQQGAWPLAKRRNQSSHVNGTRIIILGATTHNFLETALLLGGLFSVAFGPPLSGLGGRHYNHTNDALRSELFLWRSQIDPLHQLPLIPSPCCEIDVLKVGRHPPAKA